MNTETLAKEYVNTQGNHFTLAEVQAIKLFSRWLDTRTDFSKVFEELNKLRESGKRVSFGPKHYVPARKVRLGCVPCVVELDPTMPSDQIEFRMSNGHTVRVVNVQCSSPDSEGSDDATL